MGRENIIDVDELNFEEEVIDYSMNSVVILNFWAQWSKPSLEYKKILESIVIHSIGQIRLAHVNVDTSPLLSSKFSVYTLPTIKIILMGNIAGELIGYQPEFRIMSLLNSIQIPDPIQLNIEKANALLKEGDYQSAADLFREIIELRGQDPEAQYGLAVADIHLGKAIDAYYLLKDFPASKRYNDAEKLLPLAKALSQYVEGKLPENSDSDFAFIAAMRFVMANKYYQAIDGLLEIIKQNRNYGNGIAHKAVLALIELLNDDDPQKNLYRSELASILF